MMMTETTTEQLAEIEGQAAEFTPADGWRLLQVGETLQEGDVTVRRDGYQHLTERVGSVVGANQRYIRRIEPDKTQEPEDKTQEQPEYTPPDGWRLVRFGELLLPGDEIVQIDDGRRYPTHRIGDAVGANQRYIRRIKSEPEPQPEQAAIKELRSEVSYVQNQLGESQQRVAHLQELVTSLRTINEAQERAFNAANKANDDLEHRLNVVAAEWAEQVETSRRLQADLAEVTRDRDTYRHAHELLLEDANTAHERTKAMTVEAIAEWLEPVRAAIAAADNVAESTRAGWLAEEVIQHLPSIMRSLTGLDSPEDVD